MDTSLSQKLYQAALDSKGRSTKEGPEGGKLAAAWAIENFCIAQAGVRKLEESLGRPCNCIAALMSALNNGRGVETTAEDSVPGDIWFAPTSPMFPTPYHCGIVMEHGGKRILSNSSGLSCFSWEDRIEEVAKFFGRGNGSFYRLTS